MVGDYVFDDEGCPTRINFKSSVMNNHKCYSVNFSDGSQIIADEEHLWRVQSKKERNGDLVNSTYRVLETRELLRNLTIGKRKEKNYSIHTCSPLKYPEASLPLPPYVLGAWLGDGISRGSHLVCDDFEIITEIESNGLVCEKLSDPFMYSMKFHGTESTRNYLTGRIESHPRNFTTLLRKLELIQNKHIPPEYFVGSVSQRLDLLCGLMDTDGCCDARGHCEYTTTSYQLAQDVLELCLGLGIKAVLGTGRATLYGKDCGEKYRIYINTLLPIFKLTRKLIRQRTGGKQANRNEQRFIEDITEVDSVPVQCIEVDSPSHLYLAGRNLIPTHNTVAGAQKCLRKIKEGLSGAVMNPDFENFRTSTWPELRDWIPWKMVVPKHRYRASPSWEPIKPFSIVFVNGATLYCKGLKDPESARGSNVNFFWYDEGRRDLTGLGWKNAIAFCRVGESPQAWCTTTPAGTEHWTTKFFMGEMTDELKAVINELLDKGISQNLFATYKTSTKANQVNLDPFYYASLLSAYPSGYLRSRELDGEAADEGGSLGDRMWFNGKELLEYPEWEQNLFDFGIWQPQRRKSFQQRKSTTQMRLLEPSFVQTENEG